MMGKAVSINAKKAVSLFFCLALLFLISAVPDANASIYDDPVYKENMQKIEENQKLIDELKQKIESNSGDKEDLEQKIQDINKQSDAIQQQIDEYNAAESKLKGSIAVLDTEKNKLDTEKQGLENQQEELKRDKADKEKQIQDTKAKINERVVKNAMSGSPSVIEILFGAEDLATFFDSYELLKQLQRRDSALVTSLESEIEELDRLDNDLENKQKEIDNKTDEITDNRNKYSTKLAETVKIEQAAESKKSELDSNYNTAYAQIKSLDKNSKACQDLINKYNKEMDNAEAAIEAYIAAYGSKKGDKSDNDGKMTWPAPSGKKITSAFGMREDPITGEQRFHGGIDIPATLGSKIVAAQSGTVIYSAPNGSYGNCLIIDHGGGLFTLYAHCNSFAVSKGTAVTKGQTIGYIGSTGRSTGPHLHFEVRAGGGSSSNRVNPSGYVSIGQ